MKENTHIRKIGILFAAIMVAWSVAPSSALVARGLVGATKPDPRQTPLGPAPPGMTGADVFQGLVEHSRLRDQFLERYSVVRTYELGNTKGKVYAQAVLEVQYRAPGEKNFTTQSEKGGPLSKWVLRKLIDAEAETSSGKQHRDSSIAPHNYSFRLLGEQQVGPYRCYVVEATPRQNGKYLFRGRIWISQPDFGIVKISGEPASKLSFWIERVHFVRQYERIGLFWLPEKDSTVAKVRFSGSKTFTIVHDDYLINGKTTAQINAEEDFPSRLKNDIRGISGRSAPVTPSQGSLLAGTARHEAYGDGARLQANSNNGRN